MAGRVRSWSPSCRSPRASRRRHAADGRRRARAVLAPAGGIGLRALRQCPRHRASDQNGRSFVADVSAAELWNFPSEIPTWFKDWSPTSPNFCSCSNDGSKFSTCRQPAWRTRGSKRGQRI
jgi:hypothetical protein